MPMTILGINCGDEQALHRLKLDYAPLLACAHTISAPSHILNSLKDNYSAKLLPLSLPIRPFLSNLGAKSKNGQNILLLADGDPLFFGLASTLAEMGADWPYTVIPAVSSLQRACAKLGLPWANIAVLSLHGRQELFPLYKILASRQNFCLLTGAASDPACLARFMLDRGCDNYELNFFQDMGSKSEKQGKLSLLECASTHFSSKCLCLFIYKKRERSLTPILTEQGHLLGSYSTPKTRRGQILELLDIDDSDIIWDVGAGSGLLSYEMAQRASFGEVWAIEEKSVRALDIQYNRKLLSCPNLKIVFGQAPNIMQALPSPSRIFIGGGLSSPNASELLDFCNSRLLPGGCLVISCILIENLQKCLNHSWSIDCNIEFFQMQVSKGEALGKGFRFIAENPIFLVKIEKGKFN